MTGCILENSRIRYLKIAHLITSTGVIEGLRKASGEVISLSSEKKHQAGHWWDYSRGIHSVNTRNIQGIFHVMNKWSF
ncbi:hypothetical protein PFLUV_G00216070 [Perca fluviatilis]|uniref:Uncharacterized protein n=1 Tax=Perca fluviatilis TaxID=8168 RepID=A0A6A5E859_PERFL|nr:hypothetical protein PFLUV_G00216070 [Perca fluviatilis]